MGSFFLQSRSGTDLSKWDESLNWFSFKNSVVFGTYISVSYELGIDGLSLVLLLLTTTIATLAALASVKIKQEWKGYYLLFLLLEIGTLGVFAAEILFSFSYSLSLR